MSPAPIQVDKKTKVQWGFMLGWQWYLEFKQKLLQQH
jgi:hypothetical protein